MKNVLAISIVLMGLVFTACKKEASNPNIIHKNLNIQISNEAGSIDTSITLHIDNDYVEDFYLIFSHFVLEKAKNYQCTFLYNDSRNQILSQEFDENIVVKRLTTNSTIDSTSTLWQGNGLLYRKYILINTVQINYNDIIGVGDVYLGIRFVIDNKLHYGWIKMSVSSDYNTIQLKEVAYNKIPDVGIKAGEK